MTVTASVIFVRWRGQRDVLLGMQPDCTDSLRGLKAFVYTILRGPVRFCSGVGEAPSED